MLGLSATPANLSGDERANRSAQLVAAFADTLTANRPLHLDRAVPLAIELVDAASSESGCRPRATRRRSRAMRWQGGRGRSVVITVTPEAKCGGWPRRRWASSNCLQARPRLRSDLRRRSRSAASRAGSRRPDRAARPSSRSSTKRAPGAAASRRLDLVDRRQRHELLLERPREAAAAEVPAVELLQEAGRAVLAELAHRLAHEEQQLGDDLLARRLACRRP